MAKRISDLDMNDLQVLNVRLQNLATSPTAKIGKIYFNTAENASKGFLNDGTEVNLGNNYTFSTGLSEDAETHTVTLKIASASQLGGVIIGSNISVSATGEISVANASTSGKGVIEIATDAEVATGTPVDPALFDMEYYREHGELSPADSERIAREVLAGAKFVNHNGYLALSITFPRLPDEIYESVEDLNQIEYGFSVDALDSGVFLLFMWSDDRYFPGHTYFIELTDLIQYDLGGGLDEDTKVPVNALKKRLASMYFYIGTPDVIPYRINTGLEWDNQVGMDAEDNAKDYLITVDNLAVYDMFK